MQSNKGWKRRKRGSDSRKLQRRLSVKDWLKSLDKRSRHVSRRSDYKGKPSLQSKGKNKDSEKKQRNVKD